MSLKQRFNKYIYIMAVHEWIGSILGYCCICDFCKQGRVIEREWVEVTKKDPSLVYLEW